jgi:hypothetical protein
LWFEAGEGDPVNGFPGYFDFVRQFLQATERGLEYHEQITAHFTCEPGVQVGLQATTSIKGDIALCSQETKGPISLC